MPNFNSIIEAIHHHMDKMLESGLASDPSIKVQNAADALNIMGRIYVSQLDNETSERVLNENKHLDRDIADQLSFVFDAMGSFSGSINPLANLTIGGNINKNADLFGLTVDDLQNGIYIDSGRYITGNLNYVEGYTGFSIDPDEADGYFLAFKVDTKDMADVNVTIDTDLQYRKTDDDIYVVRVTDETVSIRVTVSKEGYSPITKIYPLSGLNLEPVDEQIVYDGGDGID